MIRLPLDKLGLNWQSHKSALWWLGLLYRRPFEFSINTEHMARKAVAKSASLLLLHFLPYMIFLSIGGRLIIFGWWGTPTGVFFPTIRDALAYHTSHIAVGNAIGIAFGIFAGIFLELASGMAFGIVFGVTFGVATGAASGIAVGAAFGLAYGFVLGNSYGEHQQLGFGLSFGIPLGIAVGSFGGLKVGIALIISFVISYTRVYYHLFLGIILFWLRGNFYWIHPVAWDDMCKLPFPGLGRVLVAYAEEVSQELADEEIARLTKYYPSQRWQAYRAQAIIIGRKAAQVTDLKELTAVLAKLPKGEKRFLARTEILRKEVSEIVQMQIRLDTMLRPFLRETHALALCEHIENFHTKAGNFREPLAREFRAAASHWLNLARRQWQQAQAMQHKQPIPEVFRAGDPVDREQEAFVPRYSVVGDLEQQIMLSSGCPGLVLSGRRRMGKSTVLRNLHGYLPNSVIPVIISMQEAEAFTSLAYLVALIQKRLKETIHEQEWLESSGT